MTTPAVLVSDTHPLVWYVTAQFSKLPKKIKKVFDDSVEGSRAIYIPSVVLWELSLLVKAGSVRTSVSLDEYVQKNFFAKAISILDLETKDILISHALNFSKDPFDSLIVAMSLRVECPLITADRVIHQHEPCELFWD